MKSIKTGILGLGRIGKIHLQNLMHKIPQAELIAAVNPSEAGKAYAKKFNVPIVSSDSDVIFENPDIEAVIICSPNDTHAAYVERAAKAGKAIFCEKPLDLSLEKVKGLLKITEDYGVPLMVAFNQRFDVNFSKIKSLVAEGKLGDLRSINITSRDPAPPPIPYIKSSGGLFLDMTIHDFDMARYIANSEVMEVFARGYNLVDPEIGETGDIDTGFVMLTFENRATAMIENCRQSAYGYDQRLEVFGSKGMTQANNIYKDTHQFLDVAGVHGSRPLDFFMDRYLDSYLNEMNAFIGALSKNEAPPVTGLDGLKATAIALAANKSMKENRPVAMTDILDGLG